MYLWDFGAPMDVAARALLLSMGLLLGPAEFEDRPEASNRPFGIDFGICGVGLHAQDTVDIAPCLFVEGNSGIKQLIRRPLSANERAYQALVTVFGSNLDWTKDVVVVPVGPVTLQSDPGDPISTTVTGQLGAPVQWGADRGYLTAGHVGKKVGTRVNGSAGQVGNVVFALDPTGITFPSSIDVSVVEVTPSSWGNRLGITGAGKPGPMANVQVFRRTNPNPVAAVVCGKTDWWTVTSPTTPPTTLRGVYLSTIGVTAGGDCGGPVLLAGSKTVIGHVAAGGPSTSCFQDVRHQLRRIKADPAFASIRI